MTGSVRRVPPAASVGTCNGCGVEIIAIVGAAWKVTVTTPEGRTVGPSAFCLPCMTQLALLGVKLHPEQRSARDAVLGAISQREPIPTSAIGDPRSTPATFGEQLRRSFDYVAIAGVDGHKLYDARGTSAAPTFTCECGAVFHARSEMADHHDAMRTTYQGAKS